MYDKFKVKYRVFMLTFLLMIYRQKKAYIKNKCLMIYLNRLIKLHAYVEIMYVNGFTIESMSTFAVRCTEYLWNSTKPINKGEIVINVNICHFWALRLSLSNGTQLGIIYSWAVINHDICIYISLQKQNSIFEIYIFSFTFRENRICLLHWILFSILFLDLSY